MEFVSDKSIKIDRVNNTSSSDADDDEDYDEGSDITEDVVKTTAVTRSRAWNLSLTFKAIIKRRQKLIEKSRHVIGNLGDHGWTIFEKI